MVTFDFEYISGNDSIAFNDGGNRHNRNACIGCCNDPATDAMRFVAGDGQTKLLNISLNGRAGAGNNAVFLISEMGNQVTVCHIELENREVKLANDTPAKTFVVGVTRTHFRNYPCKLDRCGASRIIREMVKPRISSNRHDPQSAAA